ncbi:MAG TPA: sigma-70 family RNA polymerase sigma factor [Thermoanaerobaculia bacterium]|nr:sigma-70 family RNA polymerase sigma factor [Thermoanaerobaculia bacterium]
MSPESRPPDASGSPASRGEITGLLDAWSAGDRSALDRLVPLVEQEIHRQARRHLRRERDGHTLQTAALVNEVYLRLVDQQQTNWHNRAQFFALSARFMRRILIDHARKRASSKRGGGFTLVSLDESCVFLEGRAAELVALDDALKLLAEVDERKSRIVELRFFAGLTIEEAAAVIGVHPDTVNRDWAGAKAFLRRELGDSR